ncbi:hypothetical protein MKW98_023462 [Papaver atlanticum]|uniref:Microtubule-binding protein TANGLED n=1 Tax=Papaver atlanticum TaxID=357466 RepID=A0AAD4XN31_9MAGN|nr:hypothetical protein MKW98_023462 [Papaver atlanticum]
MVAKSPLKLKKMANPPLNSNLLRETVKKVDRCMARLQELQYTVAGGNKVISGVSLSPRSTRAYLKTSIRCKQESLRMKTSTASRKSPVGKIQGSLQRKGGEWRCMSLPAMLVGETVGEILQASQFAREVVEAVVVKKTKKPAAEDPKTPMSRVRISKSQPECTEMKARRKREKQVVMQSIRSELDPPRLQRARSRINFKLSPNKREFGKENWFTANRVSPKNKPWAKKTVLFPNPLFLSSPSNHQHKFCKTRSPIIARPRPTTPHKFLIKSPPSNSKFQVKIKTTQVSLSPTRSSTSALSKKSPKVSTASKIRRSFSPSKLANRLVSPLRNRSSAQQKGGGMMSGLKQRPFSTPVRSSSSNWRV